MRAARCVLREEVRRSIAQLLRAATGLLGYPLDHKTMTWKETPWRTRAFREYPWTLSCMQVRSRGMSTVSAFWILEVLLVPALAETFH